MTPSSERNQERVSCKAALYSSDRKKVLLVEYLPNNFGLPGGHTEADETPEETMRRELAEELGVTDNIYLNRRDFWRHSDGKIVLGFVGELNPADELTIDLNEIMASRWTEVSDIKKGKMTAGAYDTFIIDNSRTS